MNTLETVIKGSTLHKTLFLLSWSVILFLLGFWFLLQPNSHQLQQLQKQEEKLRITITNKKHAIQKAQQHNHAVAFFVKYPLRALEFVGTMQKNKMWYALIKEPDGQITPVTINAYLAKERLKILAIEENALRMTKHTSLFLQPEV